MRLNLNNDGSKLLADFNSPFNGFIVLVGDTAAISHYIDCGQTIYLSNTVPGNPRHEISDHLMLHRIIVFSHRTLCHSLHYFPMSSN